MLERNLNVALLKADPSASRLIDLLMNIDRQTNIGVAAVYHQFPIYPDQEGTKAVKANVLLATKEFGLFIFQTVDYSSRLNADEFDGLLENLSEIDRLVYAKIIKDAPSLQKGRRNLKFQMTPVIYIHNYDDSGELELENDTVAVYNEKQLSDIIKSYPSSLTDTEFMELKATIEGSKGINKPTERSLKDKEDILHSKGAILTKIENAIYNFDLEQKRAALFILDGPQRIRGLAGSGKTVILAMKAAQIHLQNPSANILYTYYTKNLHDLVKRLITRFYRQFAEKDPNWDKIKIMHAWGGYGLDGVYSYVSKVHGVPSINLNTAKAHAPNNPFGYVCEQLDSIKLKKLFDFALLDEAQDFPVHFYRVCRQITNNNRVVWAFDDFQNILDVSLQSEKETFGKDENGNWYIDFSVGSNDELQDLILHRCYRTPRSILLGAFALGLGIYNLDPKTRQYKVLQRLESNDHWESLGFEVEQGRSMDGDSMIISRSLANSSEIKNELIDKNPTIKLTGFESLDDECTYVVNCIIDDLSQELKPDDISVVCVDNRFARKYFSIIGSGLKNRGVKSFNLQAESSDTIIFKVPNHVTLSTIYKAKGNEAGSIYIIGIDTIFNNKNDITERNKIFTAMTRSLAWVTMTGLSSGVAICNQELATLFENKQKLIFKQPTEEQVRTIHQDMSRKQSALNKIERLADELSRDLNISKDEIVDELKSKLRSKK